MARWTLTVRNASLSLRPRLRISSRVGSSPSARAAPGVTTTSVAAAATARAAATTREITIASIHASWSEAGRHADVPQRACRLAIRSYGGLVTATRGLTRDYGASPAGLDDEWGNRPTCAQREVRSATPPGRNGAVAPDERPS